ncbi:MAG: protein-L-isoaspartate(D-aspartate) O-methyltransferase [Anaerolineales bacterium]
MKMSKATLWIGLGSAVLVALFIGLLWLRSTRLASLLPTPTQGSETKETEQPPDEAQFSERRRRMVEQTIVARGIQNPDVIAAMYAVPRHRFVPEEYLDFAYNDHPLPIGYGQTISQPYIVAWMTELAALKPGERVLEIGSGSGYQAAVLAQLGYLEVYSIEIIPQLAEMAAARLRELGYEVKVRQGDGYYGWPEAAPFDAIIVTAAPDHLPPPLVQQLKEGGRIIIPIGPPGSYQTLWKFVKQNDELTAYELGGVAFVPFTGEGIQGGSPSPTP